jgi:hypothetical protein
VAPLGPVLPGVRVGLDGEPDGEGVGEPEPGDPLGDGEGDTELGVGLDGGRLSGSGWEM